MLGGGVEDNECCRVPLLHHHHHHHEADESPDIVVDIECHNHTNYNSTNQSECDAALGFNSITNPHPNPFSFMIEETASSLSLDLGQPCSIDPFRNHTPNIEGLYEWVKILICIPLAILRLVLFGLVISVGYVATKLALEGWKDKHNPLPKWRCRLMIITRLCSRAILFCFGYHWIRRSGKPASRGIAPIVVSNHVSYTDPIFFFYEFFPSIVASESHNEMPFVGTIIRAMQVIYVDRFSPVSRKLAVSEIKRKASCNDFPRVMLFPEGTTTNGRVLLSFRLGAFIPGFPIQPVIIRYPHVHFDQSWGRISILKLMFRMFMQFHNFMEVEYLPVIFPEEHKKESPVQFSKKVSYAMARALNVVQTDFSYGDLMLSQRASEMGLEPASAYMVGMAKLERPFGLSTSEAIGFLDRFAAMNPDHSGHVNVDNFLLVLGLRKNPFSEKIFQFIDMQREGRITFREFLIMSTYVLKQPNFHQLCEFAFNFCDVNNRGFLSKQEVEMAVRWAVPDLHEENVCRLFTLFDIDNDNNISWDDFKTCLERNPVLIALFGARIKPPMDFC